MKFKSVLKQMALTPKVQLKRLLTGSLGAIICGIILFIVSQSLKPWMFYLLSAIMLACIVYAICGYLGIWMWRMRKVLFNID